MLPKGLNREQEEKEQQKKQKTEPHLHTIIKVARDEDLTKQIGRDIYFDLVDFDKVRSFRVPNQMTFKLVKEGLAKAFGVPVGFQRFWFWAKRQNHTYRPLRPLTNLEEAEDVGHLSEVPNRDHNAELKLFLEVQLGPDMLPDFPPVKAKDDILLFIKLYDPEKEELRHIGRLFVNLASKPTVILTILNEMAGFAPDEEIELYEEIKFDPDVMCELINKKASFRFSQLQDGDIVCIQKSHSADNRQQFRYPDVPSFLQYMSIHQAHDMLYGELLDIPPLELQDLKTLKVAFHHATRDEPSGGLTSTGQEEALIKERGFSQPLPDFEMKFDSIEHADFYPLLKSDSYSVQKIMWEELAPIDNSKLKPTDDLDRAKAIFKKMISMPLKDGLSDNNVSELRSLAELLVSNQPELVDCLKSVCNGSLKYRLEISERWYATSEDGFIRLQETIENANVSLAEYKVAQDSNIASAVERAELRKQIDSTEEEIRRLQEELSGLEEKVSGLKEKKLEVDGRASCFKQQLSSLGNKMRSEAIDLRELKKSRSLWLARKTVAEKEFIHLEAEWDQLQKTFL